MFTPTRVFGGPDPRAIKPIRVTHVWFEAPEPRNATIIENADWNGPDAHKDLEEYWTGKTIFSLLPKTLWSRPLGVNSDGRQIDCHPTGLDEQPADEVRDRLLDPAEEDKQEQQQYYIDSAGRKYKVDEFGAIIRRSSRPKGVLKEDWHAIRGNKKKQQEYIDAMGSCNAAGALDVSEPLVPVCSTLMYDDAEIKTERHIAAFEKAAEQAKIHKVDDHKPSLPMNQPFALPDAVCSAMHDILKDYDWPMQRRESVVKSKGTGAVLGLTVVENKPWVSSDPKLVNMARLLLPLLEKHLPPDFTFTGIQVNHNTVSKSHKDRNNEGPSAILSFGEYTGGEFAYTNGGGVWDLKNKLMFMDGSKEHHSRAFKGDRWSLVLFTHNTHHEMSDEQRETLQDVGFNLPKPNDPEAFTFEIPAMPCVEADMSHHDKLCDLPYPVGVARPVGRSEMLASEKAMDAFRAEWQGLKDVPVWDESSVEEWDIVAANARAEGREVHFGYLFGIMVEKGSELEEAKRRYKYRVVFQGNNVYNQNWEIAVYRDCANTPTTMEASKFNDFYACLKGHQSTQADARRAFVQAKMLETETWVALPREAWPQSWIDKGYKRPVVRLLRALYGHPKSGYFWEKHCDERLRAAGFKPIDGWGSCYFHPEWRQFLIVYVDDLKMAGPIETQTLAWDAIQEQGIEIDPPEKTKHFLGCTHHFREIELPDGRVVNAVEYDMEAYLKTAVNKYIKVVKELTGKTPRMKRVDTPFLSEDQTQADVAKPVSSGPAIECPWCRHTFPKSEAKPPQSKIRAPKQQKVNNPEGDNDSTESGLSEKTDGLKKKGQLSEAAASITMTILFVARVARFDLLRPTCRLAQYLSKWDDRCDKQLHRLMCYVNSNTEAKLTGWVGDNASDLSPHIYADADFAGCLKTQRSTSGMHFAAEGPHSRFPIAASSKRQGCVSCSTPEAEFVAAHVAAKNTLFPAIDLWEVLIGKHKPIFHEDNTAMIRVVETGKNPSMKHLPRAHRIPISWLHEQHAGKQFVLEYTKSSAMAADIYTKAFSDLVKWQHACKLINLFRPDQAVEVIGVFYQRLEQTWWRYLHVEKQQQKA